MKDMTQGSIGKHLIEMAVPMAAGMIVQTLYFMVDLYFVARLGDSAIAGVSSAAAVTFVVMGLTQMLGVGTVALIAQAVGRKDRDDANLIFNQSLVLSALCAVIALVAGYGFSGAYMRAIGADEATMAAGISYLHWYTPGLALQFALIAMGSALRGTGIVAPTMIVQMITLGLNIVFAPILIAGWGTGYPMGVAGAGLASTLAIVVGVVVLAVYFMRLEKYVSFHADQWAPRFETWRRMLTLGLPAGGEFALMFVFMAVTYGVIGHFGSAAQAGFGIGSRVMQAIFLPAMAVAFAVPAVAGQNFGARLPDRVRETFRIAVLFGIVAMVLPMLLCKWQPALLIGIFSSEPAVIEVGAGFLAVISWNFVLSGVIFTCSGMFQALGNTLPALASTALRLTLYALPAIWLSRQPGFELKHVWYLSVATTLLQTTVSLVLVRWQMNKRLPALSTPAPAAS